MIRVIRDGQVKLTMWEKDVEEDESGYIWNRGTPVLGITDAEEKAKMVKFIKSKKTNKIPAKYFSRYGKNENGLEIVRESEWENHPLGIEEKRKEKEEQELKQNTVSIYLSSRGWGDYSPCEWTGDITKPEEEILRECKEVLKSGYDVDNPNQTDEELIEKIKKARLNWEEKPEREKRRREEEEKDIQHKIDTGFCFYCESYCYGDCGHFSSKPKYF